MNGIDDLRRTLDEHAADLVDHDVSVRRGAVHKRIAVARRRRRTAGASVAAAIVIAAVAGAVLLPNGDHAPEPAGRLVGVEVPPELTALGYTYEYSEGLEGEDGRAAVRLEASDRPRLVSWATSGDDDRVRVTEPLQDEAVPRESPDFMGWVYVPAGTDQTVRVTARSGRPGVAVYTLGDERPDGVTAGGVTFRRWLGSQHSQHLLDAAVGEPGESELTVPVTADGPGIAFYYFCSGGPEGGRVDVYVGGDGPIEEYGPCRDAIPVDGAEARQRSLPTSAGEEATVRIVVRDANGDVVDDPDIRVGVGVYGESRNPISIDGAPEYVEMNGHRWQLEEMAVEGADRRSYFTEAPEDRGVVLAIIRSEVRDATIEFGTDGDIRSEGGGGAVTELLGPGQRTGYRVVDGDLTEGDRFQIAFYVIADRLDYR
jgi:hypothetical protein